MGTCTIGLRGCCGHDAKTVEYEYSDDARDPNHKLSITSKQGNNEVIVNHIRSTAKSSVNIPENEMARVKHLEEIVNIVPVLKLKVFFTS